MAKDLQIY